MIKIEIQDQGVMAAFNELLRLSQDMSSVMKAISETLLDHTEENFAQEGRPKWPDLASSTIKERTRKGYWPGMILQRRGELAAAVTAFHDGTSAGVSVAKPYAAIHQFGGKAGRGRKVTIPPRPFLPIQNAEGELQEGVDDEIVELIRDAIAATWRG